MQHFQERPSNIYARMIYEYNIHKKTGNLGNAVAAFCPFRNINWMRWKNKLRPLWPAFEFLPQIKIEMP